MHLRAHAAPDLPPRECLQRVVLNPLFQDKTKTTLPPSFPVNHNSSRCTETTRTGTGVAGTRNESKYINRVAPQRKRNVHMSGGGGHCSRWGGKLVPPYSISHPGAFSFYLYPLRSENNTRLFFAPPPIHTSSAPPGSHDNNERRCTKRNHSVCFRHISLKQK